jgi:hypothetical protein
MSKVIATLLGMTNMENNYCRGWDSSTIFHLNIIEHNSIIIISWNRMLTSQTGQNKQQMNQTYLLHQELINN